MKTRCQLSVCASLLPTSTLSSATCASSGAVGTYMAAKNALAAVSRRRPACGGSGSGSPSTCSSRRPAAAGAQFAGEVSADERSAGNEPAGQKLRATPIMSATPVCVVWSIAAGGHVLWQWQLAEDET